VSEDIKNIISISVVIFLFVCVPIMLFIMLIIGFNIIVDIISFLRYRNFDDLFWSILLLILEVALIYLFNKLILWLRK
jgi:hypothetical protein